MTDRQLIAHSAHANPILSAMVADDLVRDRDQLLFDGGSGQQ